MHPQSYLVYLQLQNVSMLKCNGVRTRHSVRLCSAYDVPWLCHVVLATGMPCHAETMQDHILASHQELDQDKSPLYPPNIITTWNTHALQVAAKTSKKFKGRVLLPHADAVCDVLHMKCMYIWNQEFCSCLNLFPV